MKSSRLTLRTSGRLRTRRRVDADDPRRLVAEHLVAVRHARRRDDDVARAGVEAFVLDRPAHPARAHDDDVVLRRVVDVHLLDLPDRVGHEVHLDVVEPNALVVVRRAREAAVVRLVADLDHRRGRYWPRRQSGAVATMADLDELALALPQTTKELSDDGRPSYLVHGKLYCFHRGRRRDAVDPKTGERLDDVLMSA